MLQSSYDIFTELQKLVSRDGTAASQKFSHASVRIHDLESFFDKVILEQKLNFEDSFTYL